MHFCKSSRAFRRFPPQSHGKFQFMDHLTRGQQMLMLETEFDRLVGAHGRITREQTSESFNPRYLIIVRTHLSPSQG